MKYLTSLLAITLIGSSCLVNVANAAWRKKVIAPVTPVTPVAKSASPSGYPNQTVDSLVAGYGRDQQVALINKAPPAINIANIRQVFSLLPNIKLSDQKINDFIMQALTTETPAGTSANAEITRLSLCIPGSDLLDGKANDSISKYIKTQCQTDGNIYNTSDSTKDLVDANLYTKNATFNVKTLVGKSIYDKVKFTSDETFVNPAALDYILYMAGTALPLQLPPFITNSEYNTEKLKEGETSLGETASQEYLIKLRSYVSQLSAGLSNLYFFYNERLPSMKLNNDPALATAVARGLPVINNNGTWTSKLALEEYMATWRVRDYGPNPADKDHPTTPVNNVWRQTIASSTPINLQRELVYIAAAKLYELHQLRLAIQRLTITMTSMQLADLRKQRKNLNWGGTS